MPYDKIKVYFMIIKNIAARIQNMIISKILFASLISTFLIFCTTKKDHPKAIPEDLVDNDFGDDPVLHLKHEESGEEVKEFNKEIDLASVENNEHVKKWIKYFTTGKGRVEFLKSLKRGLKYKEYIFNILKRYEMPTYLYYLALIESGFKPTAYSSAHAAGVWQFIPATAGRYKLRINSYIDERRDPLRATIAAAHYLSDLRNVFNSWPLALAGYNSGESRVMNAIMRAGTRNYWELLSLKVIPRETRNYVPKFFAATIIGESLEKYGFNELKDDPSLHPKLIAVKVPSPVHINTIAKQTGLSFAKIKSFNPHFRKNYTPPSYSSYRIWLPEGVEKLVISTKLKRLPRYKTSFKKAFYHRVRRGESLATIAKKYRISIRELKKWNRLRTSKIYANSRLLIKKKQILSKLIRDYRVKRGDSLFSVARKFGVTISSLKKTNKLRSSRIYTGQRLKISLNRG